MKASECRGVVRAGLDRRARLIGYVDWADFVTATDLANEDLTEAIWIFKDVVEPYMMDVRKGPANDSRRLI